MIKPEEALKATKLSEENRQKMIDKKNKEIEKYLEHSLKVVYNYIEERAKRGCTGIYIRDSGILGKKAPWRYWFFDLYFFYENELHLIKLISEKLQKDGYYISFQGRDCLVSWAKK